jgi:iron complex outermembrane receptor protein
LIGIAQLIGISSDLALQPCALSRSWNTTTPSAKSDSLQDALRKGRKLMGKPVRFRRGIATVMPDCESGTASQITSLRGFSDVCDLQTLRQKPMLLQPTPLRGSRRSAFALIALLAHSPARAEEKKAELEPLIVSALRTARDASTIASSVTRLDPEALQNQGLLQLRDALNQAPGVISTSTSGQTGAPGALFIRGTSTKYAQIVVDGMRLSDANNQLNNLLGAAFTYDLGELEILRGPQGAIYGGESIGGVIWMETPHGSGKPGGSVTFEAGSFNSLLTRGVAQGEVGDLSYYLSAGYVETDNDAPHNAYHQGNTVLRVEGKLDSVWTVGATFRGSDSSGQDLNTSYSMDGESEFNNALGTIYATGKISSNWTARFHAGYYQESFDQSYVDSWAGPSSYFSDMTAGSISTDHEITLADNLRLLAGAFVHTDTYESTYSPPDQEGDRYGLHSTLEWDIIDNLTSTASLRWEDYDAFGTELTWRFGTIYNLARTGTTFRGSIGTSFRSPTYAELYGSAFNPPNPGLDAESATGWDLGIEQKVGAHHMIEATWFHNRISDQIFYPSFYSAAENLSGESETNGLEVGLRGSWLDDALNYRVVWTYLHESLENAGLPRNAGTASIDWKASSKSLVGVGASYLADHSWGGTSLDSSIITRLYGSYQLTENVNLHARVENVLDEDYKLYDGFGSVAQGSGTGLYAGITVDW